MRIGVSASSLGTGGGMERYALDVIGGLIDLGHEVTAFCRKADPAAPGMERLKDIRIIPCSFIPGKFRDSWFSSRLDSLRKSANLDAHIACTTVAHPDVTACGGTHKGYLNALKKDAGFYDKRRITLESAQYANARAIIAHSKMMRDELIALYGIAPSKIRLCYPPVDAAKFRPPEPGEREELRKEFGFNPGRRYFLFPSGGHERKGLPFLRPFFEEVTDLPVELVVAGRGVEPGRNVRSLGYVRNIELLYRAADATVMASSYEPFGLVGVESVLCGTPVVFPSSMGCCEVLGGDALFSFRPGDGGDFHRALRASMAFERDAFADPPSAIGYDCGVCRHVEDILAAL